MISGRLLNAVADIPRAVYKRVELCYTAGMKAYSQDLRQRVVRAVDAGQSQAEIAKTFAVSVATIKRYLKQRRETGHVLPKAIPGRPAKKGAVLQAHLSAQLEAHPDVTREEHCRLFQAEYGIEVSTASISRARAALGWTRKKRRSLPGNKMKELGQPGASKPAS
jgi:transposase